MNKNLYRIIFSKARNMFIAVGENSKSQTKAAGESTKTSTSAETQDHTALHQHWVVKSLVASISLWMPLAPVYAQIQADPSANAANRPVIGVGVNSQGQNVPVVNIQTPVNGVSHNIYKQMDVLNNGVVLNNSRTGAGSAIVGSVGANPFLAKGEARLILNEINSTAATRFEGNLEVAGQRADVIIANPAGINIKGGGFINANKAIFTTGKPQLNADGSLQQFVVDQGKVTVSANAGSNLGLGGNNNNADYVDIYARALELNAQLHANQDLNVITGANTISASLENIESNTSTAPAPILAVDIKSLGGMYANNIYLMGNEKGLGVSNAGTLQATNNLIVTSAGQIVHSGTITSTDKKNGLVSVATTGSGAAADIAVNGTINSYGLISVDSGNNLNLIAQDIALNYDPTSQNSAALIVTAKGNLNLASGTNISNLSTDGDLYIDAKNISLAANSQVLSNRGSATINAGESLISNNTANLIAAKDLNLTANKDLKLLGNLLQASTGSINVQSTAADAQLIQVDGGTLYAGKDFNVYGTGDVSLKNLSFNLVDNATRLKDINVYSGKNLSWDNKAKPIPKISGKVQLEAKQGLELSGTAIHAANGIVTQSDTLNLNSAIKSDQGIDLTTHKAMNLAQGAALTATKDVNLASLQGNILAVSLKVDSSHGRASIIAHENNTITSIPDNFSLGVSTIDKTVINAEQGIVIASAEKGSVTVTSANLSSAKGDIQILGQNGVTLNSNNDKILVAEEPLGSGLIYFKDKPSLNQLKAKSVSIGTKKGNIDIQNTDMESTVDQLHLNSEAGMLTVNNSTLRSKSNTEIYAKDILTLKNVTANSDQHLALNTQQSLYLNADYTPTATVWSPTAKTALTAKGVLSLTTAGNQLMQNTTLTGGAVLVEANHLDIKSGVILNATGSDLVKNDAKLNSLNGDLSVQTTGTEGLTIDPKAINLSAIGDIELVAKNGVLKLAGYGGTQGNGSEQVVKLNTTGGGISLEGTKVDIQGALLSAQKDIQIVSSNGDVLIDGVKSTFDNKIAQERFEELTIQKKNAVESLALLNDAYYIELMTLIQTLETYVVTELAKEPPITTAHNFNEILLERARKHDKYVKNELLKLTQKYPVKIADDGPDLAFRIGLFWMGAVIMVPKYDLAAIDAELTFYSKYLTGYEHKGTDLESVTGDVNIASSQGVSISGSNINAINGNVNIESAGTLNGEGHKIQGQYTSTAPNSVKQGIIQGSIIVDATQDSYESGLVSNDNYNWRSPVNVTTINGDKGVKIRSTGKTATDNLILQGVGITSNNGDVNIEAYKNIIFDVAIENGYDKSKKTETKRKWYGKKKTITTVSTAEQSGGVSVDIEAKNINIKSQEKNEPSMVGQNRTSIDMYSSQLTANDGKINIQAGGDLNFLVADDVSLSTVDISKKSSFIGIKYNSSNTTSTRNIKSELPAVLKADYIGTQSGFDTRLVGTEFDYLKDATIEAGGTITLEAASTTVTDTLKKDSNSVVWQSMQDKGSIVETAQLPQFNGPVMPTFKAAGGLSVQIPISEKDQNKVVIRDEILKLANQPGNAYLKELVNRNDVDWNTVILAQKDWDYKSQGLTGAGAALIVIIVTIVTMGAGTAGAGAALAGAAQGTFTATVANAAVTSLATQASVSLINNGGDLGATLKDLGSKDSVRNLATAVVTAGIMDKVGASLNIKLNDMPRLENFANNFIHGVGSTIISNSVQGESLSDTLEKALLAGISSSLQGELAQNIKQLEDINYVLHKVAHAAAGCAIGALQKGCEAGAIGAGIGEIVADMYDRNPTGANVTELQKIQNNIENTAKLVAGAVAAYAGYDVDIAANAASTAIINNSNSEIRLEIENQEAFLNGLSAQERAEWEAEFKKADLKMGELALFVSSFIPAGKKANDLGSAGFQLFKTWFQNRKIIQTFNKGGVSYRVNLPEHIKKLEAIKGTQVSGAHNKLEFEALQQTENVKILSTKQTSTKGIYEIEYQVPAYHPQKPGVITGYKRVETKTVYDPKIYDDKVIVDMSQKAAALGYKDALKLYKETNGKKSQYVNVYNGIKFRSYIAKNENGQHYISNIHVVK